MADGAPVQHERFVAGGHPQPAHVRERVVEHDPHMVEERAGRADHIAVSKAKAVEREHLEVARQRFGGHVEGERPGVVLGFLEDLHGVVALEIGGAVAQKFAGREIQKRRPPPETAAM